MSMTDPIADMLTRLRNAVRNRRKTVDVPFSKEKWAVAGVLKRAGYLKSARGAEGGYRLARPPGQISLAEIIRTMDGALAPVDSASKHFYDRTPVEQHRKLLGVFREIRDYVSRKLEKTTLADLI